MIGISYRLPYLFHGEDKGTGGGFLQGGGEVLPNKTLLPTGIWKISSFQMEIFQICTYPGLSPLL